jgi:hypothetical protein
MRKTILGTALALLVPLFALAAHAVEISAPWARATILLSRPGVAYMTLNSSVGDRLLGVTTPVADHVMIHAGEIVDGVSRMKHLDSLDLPARRPVTLAPGGTHLMLMGLNAKLEAGARFPVTLKFETAGEMTIEVSVLGIAASGPDEAER